MAPKNKKPIQVLNLLRWAMVFAGGAGYFSESAAAAASKPDYIGVWKYSGKDFYSVQYVNLYPHGNGNFSRSASVYVDAEGNDFYSPYRTLENFEPIKPDRYRHSNPVLEELTASGENNCNFLIQNQSFPLAEMEIRKVIGDELKPALLKSSLHLQPDQVTFIEAARTLEDKIVKKNYGEIPAHARVHVRPEPSHPTELENFNYFASYYHPVPGVTKNADPHYFNRERARLQKKEDDEAARVFYDVKSASAWLVSGQTLSGNLPMPLENFGDGYRLKQSIDRKKFPLVWELGRAAQINAGDLNLVLQSAVLQIEAETALLNVSLTDAFIFVHSLDDQHTKLYRQQYGMTEYCKYTNGHADQVLMVSLATFMEKLSMKNLLEGQEIKLTQIRKNLESIHGITYSFGGGEYRFRDFSHLNALGNLKNPGERISPPVSYLEKVAYHSGAGNAATGASDGYPNNGKNYNVVMVHMQDYYRKMNLPAYFTLDYDRDNYIRDRLFHLDAWVIDGDPHEASDPIAHFDHSLKLAQAVIDQKAEKLNALPAQDIAWVIRGGLDPAMHQYFAELGVEHEEIFYDPMVQKTIRIGPFFTHTTETGGDLIDLYWLPYAKVKQITQSMPAVSIEPDQKDWAEPLSGT